MKKIHCIHCNSINDEKNVTCKECGKELNELEQYFVKLVKGDLTGFAKDKLFFLIEEFIRTHIYGIVLTLTIIVGATANIIARGDNAKVVEEFTALQSTTSITEKVNEDGIAAQLSEEQMMNLIILLDQKDYESYDKLSYDYTYGTNLYEQLVEEEQGLEAFIRRFRNKILYYNTYELYDSETYPPHHQDIKDAIHKTLLKPITNPNELPTGEDIKIDNLEDYRSYHLEIMACDDAKCRGSYLATGEFEVVFVKVENEWYYLYSSKDTVRNPREYATRILNIPNGYEMYGNVYRYRDGGFHEDLTHYYENEYDY